MSKKFSKEPIRGMDDYYPSDLREINWIIENIRDITEVPKLNTKNLCSC